MINKNKLPKHWEVKKLGEVAKFIDYRGKTPNKTNSGIPLITAKNVKMGFINEEPHEYIAYSDYKKWMTRGIPQKGDILFTTEAPLGNVAQLSYEYHIALAQRLITLQPYDFINNGFLKFSLLSPKFQELLHSKGTGTTVKGIKAAILKQLEIPLPPLPEQHRIVDKLEELFSELDKSIEAFKKALELLKTYRQSVLKYAFEGRFTNKNVKKGELPRGWKYIRLSEICYKIIGGGTPSTLVKEYWNGDIPWITSADILGLKEIIPRKKITLKAVENSATNILPKGGIIVVTRVSLGKLAIAPYDICFSQDSQGLLLNEQIITHSYALICLSKLVQQFKSQSRGTTISGVTKKQLMEIEIPLPPLVEQTLIVQEIEHRLNETDKMEETINESLKQAEILRQSILKQAFEGKLFC
jgi:type I restriction enzyme, S subunit